ncbi:DUF3558 family protein [Streptomyces sp. NPDC047000]|uniref:DUF3558 family protein n=1 Tax=Streptomyces sp. NPDC047000 TaxID=3155474 RepID=UPI0033E700A4
MSEGTMHRAAQRDDRDERARSAGQNGRTGQHHRPGQDGPRRTRRTGRLHRAAVCAAALPVLLLAAGCSDSGSGGDAKATAGSGTGGASTGGATGGGESAAPSPTVQAATYTELPEPCGVLTKKTLGDLVPEGLKSAKKSSTDDPASRAGCSWNSLDNNGVKGSQFRWLNVSLLRFDSDANRGSGNAQAQTYFAKQVADAKAVTDAKNTKTEPVTQAGDEATLVRYDLKKKEGSFKQQTVVARVQNVVVTIDYNGAGLAGDKTPNADDLAKAAEKAVREVVAAVSGTGGSGSSGASASASPSKSASASASPSKSASASPSKAPSASASASATADKKN